MKRNVFIGLGIMILATAASCSKKDKITVPEKLPAVYIAGSFRHVDGDERGGLWKDSTGLVKEGSPYSYFSDVFIEGKDVYVCGGVEMEGISYWKNGIQTRLTDGTYAAAANAVFVNNGDVYVAGYEKNAAGNFVGKYWKNGTPVLLTADGFYGEAVDIVVQGTDVYVVGKKDGKIVYWKNGELTTIHDASNTFVTKIFVDKTDVYIAGSTFNGSGMKTAVYWKNGTVVTVTDGTNSAQLMDIAVHNGDVYVSGSESHSGRSFAKFWKNGKAVTLSDATSSSGYAAGIAVWGQHVFVVFTETTAAYENIVRYWHNGTVMKVSDKKISSYGYALGFQLPD